MPTAHRELRLRAEELDPDRRVGRVERPEQHDDLIVSIQNWGIHHDEEPVPGLGQFRSTDDGSRASPKC